MLHNLLEDGVVGLLKSLHSEMDSVNLSVLSVILVQLVSILCPKFGALQRCAVLILQIKVVHMLVITLIALQELQQPLQRMELLQVHHGDSLLLSLYGQMEILDQPKLHLNSQLLMIYKSSSLERISVLHSKVLILFQLQLLQPLLIPSPVLPEPPLSLPPAPPSSPSPLSTETECRA